jgi:hypothetical protein
VKKSHRCTTGSLRLADGGPVCSPPLRLKSFAGDLGLAWWSSGCSSGVEVAISGSGQRPGQPPDTQRSQAAVGVDRTDGLPGRKHDLEGKLDQVGVVGVHRPLYLRAGVDGSDQRRRVGACTHAAAHQADDGAYPDVVYVEHLTNALYLDRRDDVEQYLQVTESVCVRGDAPEKTVRILDAMLREV